MSELLNEKAFTVGYDKLISGIKHPVDVKGIDLQANIGALKRGTVIAKNATGEFVVCGSAESGLTAKYILESDVDTTSTESTVTAVVYRSGDFSSDALIVAGNYMLSENDIQELELVGNYVN